MILKKEIVRLLENRILKILVAVVPVLMMFFIYMPSKADEVIVESGYYDESSDESNGYGNGSSYTRISENVNYEEATGLYYMSMNGYMGYPIVSTVGDGMIAQGEVRLSVADGINYLLYKDGVELTDYNGETLVEPGAYSLTVGNTANVSNIPLSFIILGEYTNRSNLSLPAYCRIISVKLNGQKMQFTNSFVEFVDDGTYEIRYSVDGSGKEYTHTLQVDRVAPVLALNEVNEKYQSKRPVDISDLEEGCQILITLDDEVIPYSTTLSVPGNYTIVVSDRAGNQNLYAFRVMLYINFDSVLFILLILALGAGVGIYIFYIRKHLRVR